MQNPIIEQITSEVRKWSSETILSGKGKKQKEQQRIPMVAIGDKVSVYVKLKEGDKERIQAFKGVVIKKAPESQASAGATFTVRKVSDGIGVERVFPVHSPSIERVEIESSSIVRRSKLYYLRELKGKKARLKERGRFDDLIVPDAPQDDDLTDYSVDEIQLADTEKTSKVDDTKDAANAEKQSEEPTDKSDKKA